MLSPIAIECLRDTEGAIRLIGKVPVWFVKIRRLTIVYPFSEEISEPVRRLRAVRWRVIRFFRDCEDVPYVLGLFAFAVVFSILRLLFGHSVGLGSWDWATSSDAPTFSRHLDLENEFSQLIATLAELENTLLSPPDF